MLKDMPESAAKILLGAQENLGKLKRISYNVTTHIKPLVENREKELSQDECQVLVRRNGICSEIIGEYCAFDNKGQKVIESCRKIYRIKLQDKTIDLRFFHPKRKYIIASLYFHKNLKPSAYMFYGNETGSFLESRLDGYESTIVDLILESSNGLDYHGMDNVKDIPCYIVEATTDYGELKVWISPDYHFSILKWRLVRDRSNLNSDNRPLSDFDWFRNETQEFIYDRIERIDGHDIVASGELRIQEDIVIGQDPTGGTLIFKSQRSDIRINPDFEALGAFKIDLPEGAILLAKGGEYKEYQFTNGEIVPYVNPLHTVDDDLNLRIEKPNQSQENIK